LRVHEENRVRTVFDPTEIARRLRVVGFPGAPQANVIDRGVGDELIALVSSLADAFSRVNPIGELHSGLQDVFTHPDWPGVKAALIEAGLMEEEVRAVSGPKQVFYRRRFDPSVLMRGLESSNVSPAIEGFWESLSS
jgi:hypothetical protein